MATVLSSLSRPALMGIVNITPDSFSDTGVHFSPAAAIAHAHKLVKNGASLLDLGAEASSFFRSGIAPVDPATQLKRLLPVVTALTVARIPALVSIDTRCAEVAREAIRAGAHIINDISAGEYDPAMLKVAAALKVPLILMHISPGFPATPTQDDADIALTVSRYLEQRIAAALSAGVFRHNLLLDPGLGFGKTMTDNWRLLAALPKIHKLGYPLVLGASRKRFLDTSPPADLEAQFAQKLPKIGKNTSSEPKSEHPRDLATAAVTQLIGKTAQIHRVHNVAMAAAALRAASV
jgi:dihydropteroate synthase